MRVHSSLRVNSGITTGNIRNIGPLIRGIDVVRWAVYDLVTQHVNVIGAAGGVFTGDVVAGYWYWCNTLRRQLGPIQRL